MPSYAQPSELKLSLGNDLPRLRKDRVDAEGMQMQLMTYPLSQQMLPHIGNTLANLRGREKENPDPRGKEVPRSHHTQT